MALFDVNGKRLSETQDYFIISINHRGFSDEAPENTAPAFILSKEKGFLYVETDVQFTSDDVPVLLHDYTINRTARNADGTAISGTVYIKDITLAQAKTYDYGIWKGAKYAGTEIPTLEEFILLCKQLSIHPLIELKNEPDWTQEHAEIVADIIKKLGMENHVSFGSFYKNADALMSSLFPKATLTLGLSGTYTTSGVNSLIANATSLKTDDNEVYVTVNYQQMTSTYYDLMKAAYISPILWTVNDENVVLSMDDSVVGVLSDRVNAGQVILDNLL